MTKKKVDLSAIDTVKGSNDGCDVNIYHPGTMVDLDITINVLGKDSDEWMKNQYAAQRKYQAKVTKGGYRSSVSLLPDPEEVARRDRELLAKCTRSWSGVELDGKELEFSTDNAVMVYERFPWVKEQIDIAIGDRANFIKA